MKKKLLLLTLALLLVAGMAGAGTWAYFTDTETSTGNTFTAGTMDLKVSDWNEGFRDGVTATWTMSNMVPGVSTVGPYSVLLQNSGSIAANHVEISFSHSIEEGSPDDPDMADPDGNPSEPGDLAKWIEITQMTYNGTNFLTNYTDANDNDFFDLEDVTLPPYSNEGGPLDNLPPPIDGGTRTFLMALRFNAGATDDIQGDRLITMVTFTLNQDASQ